MKVSEYDIEALRIIRENVESFLRVAAERFDKKTANILEIGPPDQGGARQYFTKGQVKTLDNRLEVNPDYKADICTDCRNFLYSNSYSVVVCLEVLEHTKKPWLAVDQIYRILKPGGIALVSTPFNFRIHGPGIGQDFFRFTEHGLRSLFSYFSDVQIEAVESDRFLFPYHYTVVATK